MPIMCRVGNSTNSSPFCVLLIYANVILQVCKRVQDKMKYHKSETTGIIRWMPSFDIWTVGLMPDGGMKEK